MNSPDKFQNLFPLDEKISYLNHAAVSPWPLSTAKAISDFANENATLGASQYRQWEQTELDLKRMLAALINEKDANDIALVKNTSEGLSMIAYGLPWQAGDEIIISDEEFPSNRIVWESLIKYGVTLKEIKLDKEAPEKALLEAINANTRLLSISSVQYASGLALDLEIIGKACKESSVLFCVDAIQSLGVLEYDNTQIDADFVVADGHKWLLAPEGLALFYSKSDVRKEMSVNEYGWHMVNTMGNYDTKEWKVESSARRFECGSPNMLGVHGLHASLRLINEIGIDTISKEVKSKVQYLIDNLKLIDDLEFISPINNERFAGIVTFNIKSFDSLLLKDKLIERKVICACRGGGLRFSPHFYTTKRSMDQALKTLKDLISE